MMTLDDTALSLATGVYKSSLASMMQPRARIERTIATYLRAVAESRPLPSLPPRVVEAITRHTEALELEPGDVVGKVKPGLRTVVAACRRGLWREIRRWEPQPTFKRIALWFEVDHTTIMLGCDEPRRPRKVVDGWTDAMDAQLRHHRLVQGLPAKVTARLMGRTPGAVNARADKLRRRGLWTVPQLPDHITP